MNEWMNSENTNNYADKRQSERRHTHICRRVWDIAHKHKGERLSWREENNNPKWLLTLAFVLFVVAVDKLNLNDTSSHGMAWIQKHITTKSYLWKLNVSNTFVNLCVGWAKCVRLYSKITKYFTYGNEFVIVKAVKAIMKTFSFRFFSQNGDDSLNRIKVELNFKFRMKFLYQLVEIARKKKRKSRISVGAKPFNVEFNRPNFNAPIFFKQIVQLNNCQEANASPTGCSKNEYRNICVCVCHWINEPYGKSRGAMERSGWGR